KGELRSDSSDEQVVSGRDIDLDATADRRAERDALRLLAVTADADVGSKGQGAGVVEPEQACSADADTLSDVLAQLAGRLHHPSVDAARHPPLEPGGLVLPTRDLTVCGGDGGAERDDGGKEMVVGHVCLVETCDKRDLRRVALGRFRPLTG